MRGSLYLIMAILFCISCSKEKNFDNVLVIGHAAMGLENMNSVYHDNSMEAYELALSMQGCNGVELDVQASKDGKLWFYHDVELQSQTDGEGCIPNRTSSELAALRYKGLHREKLFSIDQLDTTLLKGRHLFLDLRHYNACSDDFMSLSQMINQMELAGLRTPEGYSVHCITGYKQWVAPLISAGFNVCFSVYSMDEVATCEAQFPFLEGYIVKNKDFTDEEVSNIQKANKKVYIFEVRSPKGIRKALKKHPDGILTDDIRATLIEKN